MLIKNIGHATATELAWLRSLEERLQKNPSDINALIDLGFLYLEPLHAPEQALAILEHAAKLAPQNVDAKFWLAKTLYHDHFRNIDAKIALEQALAIDQNRADCCDLLASVLRSLRDDREKSIALLLKAIELEPTWITPRITLGYYLLEKNDFDNAESLAKEADRILNSMVFPTTSSPKEEYFEECITGRVSARQKNIDDLLNKISEQRAKQ